MFRCTSVGVCVLTMAMFISPVLSSVTCNGCAAPHQCVGNSNVQAVTDEACEACASGQTWWPCNIADLCFCWDPSKPRVPPPPSSGLDFAAVAPCDLLTEDKFNTLTDGLHQAPYTYAGLCAAIADYNRLHPTEHAFKMGTLGQQKAEMAAFLGNTLHESDMFKAPREYLPCGDSKVVNGKTYCKPCADGFDWVTKQCSISQVANGGSFISYCDSARSPPDACSCGPVTQAGSSEELAGYMEADKAFFGRGAIQLSWNYNYIRASTALTGDPNTFCAHPDLVATVEKYAWGAGLYFWMENMKTVAGSDGELSTCHIQALSGEMGGTLWNINGGEECPAAGGEAVVMRINHYCRAATVMGVQSLLSFDGCAGMKEAFANCDPARGTSEGGCPDCMTWKQVSTSSSSVSSTTATSPDTTTTSSTTTIGILTATTTVTPLKSTSSMFLASTTTTTTTTASPAESCKMCSSCISIPGNPHSATDQHCSPCAMDGQSWWPCNVDALCQCAGGPGPATTTTMTTTRMTTTTRMATTVPASTAAPRDSCKTCSTCISVPGNPHAATDVHCSPCAMDGQPWWPCNVDGLCQCAGM